MNWKAKVVAHNIQCKLIAVDYTILTNEYILKVPMWKPKNWFQYVLHILAHRFSNVKGILVFKKYDTYNNMYFLCKTCGKIDCLDCGV